MNPDPVCSQRSDPDPVQIGPDPQHWWREILEECKEDCACKNISYATLLKQEFPKLLNLLMQKDFYNAIRGGFETQDLPFQP
jgi:hypothetical protein